MSETISGHCLCGAVSFTAAPEKLEVGACHCHMCRRWSSGPLLVVECGDAVRFTGEDNLTVYRSSEWGERGFCRNCGSAIFWRMQGGGHYAISAGALDSGDKLIFASEIFIDHKPPYYDFANDTRKMTGAQFIESFSNAAKSD